MPVFHGQKVWTVPPSALRYDGNLPAYCLSGWPLLYRLRWVPG